MKRMNTYYRYRIEEDDSVHHVELDHELYCLRSISSVQGTYRTSNILVEGHFLPEGSFEDALEELTAIEKSEFESVWKIALKQYRQEWVKIKEVVYPGRILSAKIVCFYPQGVIMDIDARFVGILSMDDCKRVFGEDYQYPGNKNEFKVAGFVEEQMWVTLVEVDE